MAVLALALVGLPGVASARSSTLTRPTAGELVLRGGEPNNTFVIRATGTDSGSYSLDGARPERFSGIRSLRMDGVGGHDVCRIVNPRHGLFAPPGGISCNGGNPPGHPRRGVLELIGGAATGGGYTPGRPGAGTITHRLGDASQVIRFTGLAPVVDTVAEPNLTFTEPSANDTVSLVNAGTPGELTIESANHDFESLTFANKASVNINADQSGDQELLNFSQSASGLSSLTLDADSNITSEQTDLSGVSLTLQGGGSIEFAGNTTSTGTLTATTTETGSETSTPLPEPDDDITVDSGVTVESTSGDVKLTSGDNVVTQSSSVVKSDTGNVTLAAGVGDVDNDGALILHGSLQAPNGTVTPGYPSASISTPAPGAYYAIGQPADSSFTCADGTGGPGIATCLDQNDNASGQPFDTSTVGSHTYTVTATSKDDLSAPSSVTYNVAAPPSVTIDTPVNGATYTQGQMVDSKFTCVDGPGGTGIASCLDFTGNPSGSSIDTLTLGQHMFTATATSKDGLTKSASVPYTVTPAPTVTTTTTVPGQPPPGGPPTVTGGPSATTPPAPAVASSSVAALPQLGLSHLRVRPHAFRAAARGRAVVTAARAGATVTYRDSLAAGSTFRVYRKLAGVRRGHRCVKAPSGLHAGAGKGCTRLVLVGWFRHRDHPGADRLRFTGRIGGHALSPGAYVLKATAKLGGQLSRTVSASFVILPPL